jgi:hypothetical protein
MIEFLVRHRLVIQVWMVLKQPYPFDLSLKKAKETA